MLTERNVRRWQRCERIVLRGVRCFEFGCPGAASVLTLTMGSRGLGKGTPTVGTTGGIATATRGEVTSPGPNKGAGTTSGTVAPSGSGGTTAGTTGGETAAAAVGPLRSWLAASASRIPSACACCSRAAPRSSSCLAS